MDANANRGGKHSHIHMRVPACDRPPACTVLERPASMSARDDMALDRLSAYLDNWLADQDDGT